MIMNPKAQFPLACRLRSDDPPSLGEVFTFPSGLYFRGKLAYANAFSASYSEVLETTPTRGLVPAATLIGSDDLREFAEVDIQADDPRYPMTLARDVKQLAKSLGHKANVVVLGSVATGKYVDVLLAELGMRLVFPADFVGRGDISRGGLLLRNAVDRIELNYVAVEGAVRRGKRPPKLEPRRYTPLSQKRG